MHHFCTYFDNRFIDRGLALYESLNAHCASFNLWVLCLDQPCMDVLKEMNLSSMKLVSLRELERADPDLLHAKSNRTNLEYYFTCSPVWPRYLLERNSEITSITYLDADLYFYRDPAEIYERIGNHSIAIIPHNYPQKLQYREKYGIFNVGFIYWKRDNNGLACLNWWRRQCIAWCHARVEGSKFADQKYLDVWPDLFEGVTVLKHKGLNVAAWNLANYRISADGDNQIFVDEQPLVFFHFQGLRRIRRWLYDPHTLDFGLILGRALKEIIYRPYIRTLCQIERAAFSHGLSNRSTDNLHVSLSGLSAGRRMRKLLSLATYITLSVITRNYIVVH